MEAVTTETITLNEFNTRRGIFRNRYEWIAYVRQTLHVEDDLPYDEWLELFEQFDRRQTRRSLR